MSDYSILVVEDEHTLRRLLEYRLRKHYNVHSVANGQEALQSIAESIPDLIISDIMMPQMDGFALQNALQDNKDTRAIPFIFLTAKADDMSRIRGMRTGVDDYITKPFDLERLLSRIERLLERTAVFKTQLDGKIGADFSSKLMPKKMPAVEGYEIDYLNRPKEHGGGDLFDWMQPVPNQYFFTIGDVMGKGLQAKFYAFSFLSYIRGTLHTMLGPTVSPAEILHSVNAILLEDEIMEDTFASLLLIRWDSKFHRLTYANAGHCRPFLVSDEHARIVPASDIILGLDEHAEYADHTVDFPPGSALIAYTDGLIEQSTHEDAMLGEAGLSAIASNIRQCPHPLEALLKGVLEASPDDTFNDDILAFWLKRNV